MEDIELGRYSRSNNLILTPNGDRDSLLDGLKDSGPIITQNTILGNSNCFKDSSILNKNITNITGLAQSKNETLYDYSNGKKFFDNSVVGDINFGISMNSLIINNEATNNNNVTNDNNQNNLLKSLECSKINILADSQKDLSLINNELDKIESNKYNNPNNIKSDNNNFLDELKQDKIKNNVKIINNNKLENTNNNVMNINKPKFKKKRSTRRFIQESEKDGIDFMNIHIKEDKEVIIPMFQANNKNSNSNNNGNFSLKAEFPSRRNKQNKIYDINKDIVDIKDDNKLQIIPLSKLLEDSPSTHKKANTGNQNDILFGIESRRGHNNSNINKINKKK